MTHQPPVDVGRAYFPEQDLSPNGTAGRRTSRPEPRLPALPRRRPPAMIALGVLLAGMGAMLSGAVYRHGQHGEAVRLVTGASPPRSARKAAHLSEFRRTDSPRLQ